jgi:hypothetical protein
MRECLLVHEVINRTDSPQRLNCSQHKLEGITGISFRNQRLVLYQDVDSAEALGQPVCVMDDEQGTLSRYGVQEYQCIKVSNPRKLVAVLRY